jgi:hypothetical protein
VNLPRRKNTSIPSSGAAHDPPHTIREAIEQERGDGPGNGAHGSPRPVVGDFCRESGGWRVAFRYTTAPGITAGMEKHEVRKQC